MPSFGMRACHSPPTVLSRALAAPALLARAPSPAQTWPACHATPPAQPPRRRPPWRAAHARPPAQTAGSAGRQSRLPPLALSAGRQGRGVTIPGAEDSHGFRPAAGSACGLHVGTPCMHCAGCMTGQHALQSGRPRAAPARLPAGQHNSQLCDSCCTRAMHSMGRAQPFMQRQPISHCGLILWRGRLAERLRPRRLAPAGAAPPPAGAG